MLIQHNVKMNFLHVKMKLRTENFPAGGQLETSVLVGPGFPNIADALGCLLTATLFVLNREIVVTIDDSFTQKLVNCVVASTASIFA